MQKYSIESKEIGLYVAIIARTGKHSDFNKVNFFLLHTHVQTTHNNPRIISCEYINTVIFRENIQ